MSNPMRWPKITKCALAAVIVLTIGEIGLANDGSDPVAVAIEVRGDWVVEGPDAPPVRVGQALPSGARLRTRDPNAVDAKIALGLVRGPSTGQTLVHSCAGGACRTQI